MERLELTMTVELPMSYGHCNLDRAIMHAAKEYCDELWIDNQLIPWSNADVLQPETPIHFIKYIFKPGVDYILRGDTLINLQDEKREIIKKLKDISRDALLEKVFGDAGLSFQRYEKDLTFPFQGNGYLSVHYTGDMTMQKATQVADIASRFKRLIDSSDLVRRRQNPPAIGNLSFHDTKISLTLHLESDDSVSLYKGTGKLFSQMVTQMSRLKREYGNKLLEYRISC